MKKEFIKTSAALFAAALLFVSVAASAAAKDVSQTEKKITGKESTVGGVYVKGIGSEYILSDATINLAGTGSGLGGTGTGAISDDHSTLILKNCKITTEGRARGATAATSYSTLKVYNSTLTAHGEPFEEGSGGPPAALEISGNSRCHVTMSNSYSYYSTSKWTATKDSRVKIIGDVNIDRIDAPAGVTITATAGEAGTFTLASGGKLVLKKS